MSISACNDHASKVTARQLTNSSLSICNETLCSLLLAQEMQRNSRGANDTREIQNNKDEHSEALDLEEEVAGIHLQDSPQLAISFASKNFFLDFQKNPSYLHEIAPQA